MTESEVEVTKEELRQFQRMKLITRIRELKDQKDLFEKKYKMDIKDFEVMLRQQEEDFSLFDISLEWKAVDAEIKELENQLSEVEHTKSFRITE
ncbi:MAG: hypothetical protein HeimC2_35500 [Candidatus Heimdallarchaeota archaeon LC_2]|nr:MAG: hypothetical protein HeimC2_35500 [Candidatus Heimdallarchaeota archaeon LC_2]